MAVTIELEDFEVVDEQQRAGQVMSLDDFNAAEEQRNKRDGGRLMRELAQGALLFGADELEAGVRTGFGAAGDYGKTLDEIRAGQKAFRAENPGQALAANIAGGAVIPFGVARSSVRAPQTLGQVTKQGAKLGAGIGATAGFLDSEGGFANRARGGVGGGAVGGLAGGLMAPAAVAVGKAVGGAANLVTRPANQSARQVVRTAKNDGINLRQIRDDIAPRKAGSNALPREQVDSLLQSFAAGHTQKQAATLARVSPGTVSSYYERFRRSTRVPRNLVDLAVEQAGPGGARNLLGQQRAAASIPGKGQDITFKALKSRRAAQQTRLHKALGETEAGAAQSTAARIRAESDDLRDFAGPAYARLRQHPPLLVNDQTDAGRMIAELRTHPEFEKAEALARRMLARKGDSTATQDDMFTFDLINETQKLLRRGAKAPDNFMEARHWEQLRQDLLGVTEQHFEGFPQVRNVYRESKELQEAMGIGRKTGLSQARDAQEQMAHLDKLKQHEVQGFNRGFADAVGDELSANKAWHHDATRGLVGTGRLNRQRSILGDEWADLVRAEHQIAQNENFALTGSRTTPLAEEISQLGEDATTAARFLSGDVYGGMRAVGEKLARYVREGNAEEIAKILTEVDQSTMIKILDELIELEPVLAAEAVKFARIILTLTGSVAGTTSGQALSVHDRG
jgi:hypothetical protein